MKKHWKRIKAFFLCLCLILTLIFQNVVLAAGEETLSFSGTSEEIDNVGDDILQESEPDPDIDQEETAISDNLEEAELEESKPSDDLDDQETLAESDIIKASGSNANEVKAVSEKDATIYCYAIVDGAAFLVETLTGSRELTDLWGSSRFFITGSELEEIYEEYGFSPDELDANPLHFPHTDTNNRNVIWDDVVPIEDDGEWIIPLSASNRTTAYLYYLPGNNEGADSYFTEKANIADKTLLADNTFYTVKVADPDGTAYPDPDEIPETQYVFHGTYAEATVRSVTDSSWTIYDPGTGEKVTPDSVDIDSDNETITYGFKNISSPITIEMKGEKVSEDVTLNCYVIMDGNPYLVDTLTQAWGPEALWNGAARHYLTAEDLEQVYGKFGFSADNYNGELVFPHTDTYDPNTLWADTKPIMRAGEWLIPLSYRTEIYLYYLPNNTGDSAITTSVSVNDAAMLSKNTFHQMKISDPFGIAYSDTADIPETQYCFTGDSLSRTVNQIDPEIGAWEISTNPAGHESEVTVQDNGDGTITYSASNVSCSFYITAVPDNLKNAVVYRATLEGQKEYIGGTNFSPDRQQIIQDGTVNGVSEYADLSQQDSGTYTVLSPDYDRAEVLLTGYQNNNRKFFYTFQGWKNEKTGEIVQPGTILTPEQLMNYRGDDGQIIMTATWTTSGQKHRIGTVNFYLNLNCEIMDNESNGFKPDVSDDAFTDSIYATRLFGGNDILEGLGNVMVLAPPDNETKAYEVDQTLRSAIKTPIEYKGGYDNKECTAYLTLEDFPSDESVLASLRENNTDNITIDGVRVPVEDLTTENFAIRWYVLKYNTSDGWHIDGVLVAKEACFTVAKTFAGDLEAINKVKNNGYYISIKHESDSNGTTETTEDMELVLKPESDVTEKGKLGYRSYDSDTNSYIWVVPARQGRKYEISEQNYLLSDIKWTNSCYYMVLNTNSGAATSGWQRYNVEEGKIEITAESYPDDVPLSTYQAVVFRNVYVQAGLLTLTKIDYTTQNGLKSVNFKLSRVDGERIRLYRKKNTYQYSADAAAVTEGYEERIDNNTVQTSPNGNVYVKLAVGEYYLEEELPTGYDGARKIQVEVSDDGEINVATVVVDGDAPPEDGWIEGVGTANLTIRNRSKLLTSVLVKKDWGDTPEAERLPVTVELWRNGEKLRGTGYTQVLNKKNNWQYEWHDLPLFIDGEVADYRLREVMIGQTAYDANADADGYEDYMVTYDSTLYKEGEDGDYREAGVWSDSAGIHYADHAMITIHNTPNQNSISFTKTDESGRALANAKFGLYPDEQCEAGTEIATAVSDTAGFVKFSSRSVGTYYVKEMEAPLGYDLDDTVYKAVIRGKRVTFTRNEDTTGESVTKITNRSHMELVIRKAAPDGTTFLKDAEFQLWKESTLVGTFTTGRDGTVSIPNLSEGDYRLLESKAPAGYYRCEDEIILRVKNGEISFVDASVDGNTWKLAGTMGTSYTLTVTDKEIYSLPSVGGLGIYIPTVLGTLFMCLAAAVIVFYFFSDDKKKRKHTS